MRKLLCLALLVVMAAPVAAQLTCPNDPPLRSEKGPYNRRGYELTSAEFDAWLSNVRYICENGGTGGGGASACTDLTDASAAGCTFLAALDATAQRAALGLGTAAVLNVPASGNAASGEVVKGSDTRLSDARTPIDDGTFAKLAGRAGGQTLYGGSASGKSFKLFGNSAEAGGIVIDGGDYGQTWDTFSLNPGILMQLPSVGGGFADLTFNADFVRLINPAKTSYVLVNFAGVTAAVGRTEATLGAGEFWSTNRIYMVDPAGGFPNLILGDYQIGDDSGPGTLRWKPTASPPKTCDAAADGMVYSDTDHQSYYCNGTTWSPMVTQSLGDGRYLGINANATTATALDANGSNCLAGNYARGVDASGAAENCTADDDTPDAGDFGAAADLDSNGAVKADAVALGTDTTGGYAASTTEGGPATTATALAANGANCSAGSYPLGVDASGAVEGCTAVSGGANPAGSGSEIQYRVDGSTFGAVTSSSVSGANVTFGGDVTISSTSKHFISHGSGGAGSNQFGDIGIASGTNSSAFDCTASGSNSYCFGRGAVATAQQAIAIGGGSGATGFGCTAIGPFVSCSDVYQVALGGDSGPKNYAELAFGGVAFSARGDSQYGLIVLKVQTTNATPTELSAHPTTAKRIVLPNDSTFAFSCMVVARRTDADGESAAYKLEGVIDRNTNAASTALVGTVTQTVLAEDNAGWDVVATADTTNGALILTVTGEGSKTIRWVSTCQLAEVLG